MVIRAIFVFHELTVFLLLPAKTFEKVQGAVAELVKNRILIGHAIQNDLKVCTLLAHVWRTNTLPSGPHALTSAGANSRHADSGPQIWSKPLRSTSLEDPGTRYAWHKDSRRRTQ